jgi:hypothetical protein
VTPLPDWLVERAALGEVPPANRERLERADPRELAERTAALRTANAAELAAHPAGPALAQIEARVAAEARRRAEDRRRQRVRWLGVATTVAAVVVAAQFAFPPARKGKSPPPPPPPETTRVKGAARLLAFRQVGDQVARLDADALVRAGDVVQLRYNAGGQRYGVIASIDGAGVVTLHFPAREDAPPQATAVSQATATLPHAYALDDAPRFERFFFVTADEPIDLARSLAALHALAARADAADAALELPPGLHQWSLRLRKPAPNHESP